VIHIHHRIIQWFLTNRLQFVEQDESKGDNTHVVSLTMESNKRCIVCEHDFCLNYSLLARATIVNFMRQTCGFVSLIKLHIADTIFHVGYDTDAIWLKAFEANSLRVPELVNLRANRWKF